jgi:hypothetical protein
MSTLTCDIHGPQSELIFDGYDFGDRLLEGVLFIARFNGKELVDVRIHPDYDNDYWIGLDKKYWLHQAKESISADPYGQCIIPNCKQDVTFDD